MFITKMSLPRRTFLRGVGATVALPLLEAMVPAFTATAKTAANAPMRFGAVYIPHGAIMDQYTPKVVGRGFGFTPILKPLEPFKDSLIVVSNLDLSKEESLRDRIVPRAIVSRGGVRYGIVGAITELVSRQVRLHEPAEPLELAPVIDRLIGGVLASR